MSHFYAFLCLFMHFKTTKTFLTHFYVSSQFSLHSSVLFTLLCSFCYTGVCFCAPVFNLEMTLKHSQQTAFGAHAPILSEIPRFPELSQSSPRHCPFRVAFCCQQLHNCPSFPNSRPQVPIPTTNQTGPTPRPPAHRDPHPTQKKPPARPPPHRPGPASIPPAPSRSHNHISQKHPAPR